MLIFPVYYYKDIYIYILKNVTRIIFVAYFPRCRDFHMALSPLHHHPHPPLTVTPAWSLAKPNWCSGLNTLIAQLGLY